VDSVRATSSPGMPPLDASPARTGPPVGPRGHRVVALGTAALSLGPLGAALGRAEYTIATAALGPAAFDRLAACQPDLLVIEFATGQQAGRDLRARLHGEAATRQGRSPGSPRDTPIGKGRDRSATSDYLANSAPRFLPRATPSCAAGRTYPPWSGPSRRATVASSTSRSNGLGRKAA